MCPSGRIDDSKESACREDSLPGWRSSAQSQTQVAQPIDAHKESLGSYQPTNLIKSIESRIRDSVAGDSQQRAQPRRDAYTGALTELASADSGFVTVGKSSYQPKQHDERNSDPGSSAAPYASGDSESESTKGEPAHQSGSRKTQGQGIVVVLSVDDDRQQLLEDTSLLWQVSSSCPMYCSRSS